MFVQQASQDIGLEKKFLPRNGIIAGTATIIQSAFMRRIFRGGSLGLAHTQKITKIEKLWAML